jgi:hypothetical protein
LSAFLRDGKPPLRYFLTIAVTSLERIQLSGEGGRRGRSSRSVWLAATMMVAAIALAAAGSIAVILLFALPGTPPVATDPSPAKNTSIGQTFALTKVLISDPFVLSTSKLDYVYSSGVGGVGQLHLPERTFVVMGKYLSLRDAMPTLPAWVEPNTGLWSPDVRKVGKTYVMWFSGRYKGYTLSTGQLAECIGVATSMSPTGPFNSPSLTPTICQTFENGDIDPRTLVAPNGQEWLYWKNDGNAGRVLLTTHIYAQRLEINGQTPIGATSVLLASDLPWELGLIEAPDMVRVGSQYLLFFTGNSSWGESSGIGLALCKGPGGPCDSPYSGPWLGSNVQGAGPGEETVYTQNGVTWMLYTPHSLYYPFALPTLVAARIAFTPNGMPYIADRQGMVPGVTAGREGQVGLR